MSNLYYNIREAMGLVTYETIGFGYILARANKELNYRRVLGFRVLGPNTSKRCEFTVVKRLKNEKTWLKFLHEYYIPHKEFKCNRKAAVGVLMEIGDKKFMIYLCPEHFKKFMDNLVRYVREKTEKAYTLIMEKVNEANPLGDIDVESIGAFFQDIEKQEV